MTMFFRQEDMIARLCRESGRWLVARRQGDCAFVQANDHRAVREIMVRGDDHQYSVLFQSWFPVRFSLQDPPSGLFGRLLLRNLQLHYAAWAVAIGESCEACPTVAALVPRAALDAGLFDYVCNEIRDEVDGFQKELHEKFLYTVGTPVQPAVSGPARHVGTLGRPLDAADIRYLNSLPVNGVPALRRPGGRP